MSKKKKKQGNNTFVDNSKAPETVTAPEMIQVPEIKEIQERREVTEDVRLQDNITGSETKKNVVMRVLFGSLVTAAILFLGICLYKTVDELRTVQTMSDSLQTDLKDTEIRLAELLKREEAFLAELQKDMSSDGGEDVAPEITKKPRVTPEPEQYTVCIDAGHGAHDTGAKLEREDGTERYEKDDN